MHKYIYSLILLFCVLTSKSQDYITSSFQDEYVEIDDYNSIALETLGMLYWFKRFELDFEFPFFEHKFDHLNCNEEAICSFDGDLNFSVRLFAFGYTYDNLLDTVNISSDVRYKYTEIDGLKALVVQFTKNRLFSDHSVEEFDSFINFQWWFIENGTIEIRFGPSNLDNSPVYIPGEGFYLLTNQGPIPAGPQVALYHPYDVNRKLTYNDLSSHEEFEVYYDGVGSVDYVPPSGWVIRFENLLTSSADIGLIDKRISISPNPCYSTLNVHTEDLSFEKIELYDVNGRMISTYEFDVSIDISFLENGIYFLRISNNENYVVKKVVKN